MILLENYELIEALSIGEVANMCSVSKSAISKFVRKLDYEDYASFRAAAPFEENKFGFVLNYNQNIAEYIEQNGIDSYAKAIQADIDYALKVLDMGKITELAKDLIHYKKIIAFGLLFSEIGAIDLQQKLAYNKKFIITKMSDVKQVDVLDRADEDTLIIIYSNSGSYMMRYQLSEFQEEKDFSKVKGKVVLITSNKEMEYYKGVDLCISFGHTTKVQTHSNIYPFVNDIIVMKYRELTRRH
jgi:DNA-binding MurR/RpiR family transcriptional regulator